MSANIFGVALSAALLVATGVAQAGPKIEQWQTSNGARVYFVSAPDLPMLDVQLVFDAGSARDNGKFGLASFTNNMLNEGAGGLDANEIAARFENIGASYGSTVERDMAVVGLRTLTDPPLLNAALENFATVLAKPEFPQKEFERVRQQTLIGLAQAKQSPDAVTEKAFYAAIYGQHPYATEPSGDEETVKALSVDHVQAFYKQYYVAKNAVVAMVGALSRADAERVAEQITQGLAAGASASGLPAADNVGGGREQRVAFPSSQTHVLSGFPTYTRNDPDYFALYVGNHILGGNGLVSRMSEQIREKRGLAYSAYSHFVPMRAEGPFIVGFQTRTSQAVEALQVMRATLNDFVTKGPTEEELRNAKLNITGGFALRIASNKSIVQYLAVIGFYKLPLDFLDTYVSKINAVTLAQLKDAFKRRVVPANMVTVVVGSGPV
ncbi:MAG: insulinase family protein [Gammaproteobacteria bacterium]|nr:insulinase family protein [Gammaproteobacteria bacterium]